MQDPAELLRNSMESLSMLFSMKFKQIGGVVVVTNNLNMKFFAEKMISDPVGYEASENHFHLDYMISRDLSRKVLMDIGKGIIFVWNERIHTMIDDNVIFYLGGDDSIILRFHLERGDDYWLPPHNTGLLKREKMAVLRGTSTGIETLFAPKISRSKQP
ncbi:hypothetical protein F8S13_05790 [Chloroflexia bacterium SDU3-3]|nr:hypothetical protein F8S13_05790 [Chloroflexia bacterium SDU3-3]